MSVTRYNISTEIPIPVHDKEVLDESDAANVTITYYKDNNMVAKKTIAVSGSVTTVTVTY
jgi:phage-related protein